MYINAGYINPFLEAASNVFKLVFNVDLCRGKIILRENSVPTHEVVIVIGVTGSITGEVIYSMSYNTVYKIAGTLMPGITEKQIMEEYKDIIGEIANMITGNAMIHFDHSGQLIEITTPTVFNSRDLSENSAKRTTLSINLYSPLGQVEMNIAFK